MSASSGKRFSLLIAGAAQLDPYEIGAATYKLPVVPARGDAASRLAARLEGLIRIAEAQRDPDVIRGLCGVLSNLRARTQQTPPAPWDGTERRRAPRPVLQPAANDL